MSQPAYMLENRAPSARDRLLTFERFLDPVTRGLLEPYLPVDRMWIPGAGAGAIVRWAAPRVRSELVATDIDTRFLDDLGPRAVARRHDLVDGPPLGTFDLIAVRLVLCHLRERERALAKLVSSLAPGGVLVVEEPSRGVEAMAGRSKDLFNRTMRRIRRVQHDRGFSYAFAATLPRRFLAHGLTDIRFSSRYDVHAGDAHLADLIRAIWRQVGEAAGVSLSAALDALEDEDLVLAGFENVACSGRQIRTNPGSDQPISLNSRNTSRTDAAL